MMMAYGHATSGWATALMLINALGLFPDSVVATAMTLAVLAALAMAGSAIICDWDHPNSTITTALGPFSFLIHRLVIELHYTVASATTMAGETRLPGPHRGVTHWWPFPLAAGALIALGAWWSQWVIVGVLFVLYTGAIRALTVTDYQVKKTDTIRHRWTMVTAHGIIDMTPAALTIIGIIAVMGGWLISKWVTYACIVFIIMVLPVRFLKKARKHVNRSYRIGGYWFHWRIPIGKISTAIVAAGLALLSIRFEEVTDNGYWLGALVCIGMYVHILGDAPTEMGIPGFRLHQYWRLPKWLAFRAGGPFEVIFCWIPLTALGIYLIPGLRPREEVLMVQTYVLWGLGAAIVLAFLTEAGSTYMRKRSLIR